MSARIRIFYRIPCSVGVQVQRLRPRPASSVGVLGQEASVCRVVVSGPQVVEACRLVVYACRIAYLVVERFLRVLLVDCRLAVVVVAVGRLG